jgi:outer membrane protein OmpA-like peptidoglycan-associated protein
MKALADLGDRAAIAGRTGADAARRVGAAAQGAYRETVGAVSDGTRWLSALAPLALLLLALPLFAWLVKGAGEKIEQAKADAARAPAQAEPRTEVAQTPKPAPEIVRTDTNTPLVPTSLELRDIQLPGGATLKLPRSSFLNAVYGYLTDVAAPRNRAFVFDGLDFDNATNRVRPESETAIADLTTLLRAFPAATLRIEGYTDPSGDPEADRRVSLARAQALRDLLVKAGVPAERITAEGLGSDKPVADNNTAEGRAKNRRIELSLTKSS